MTDRSSSPELASLAARVLSGKHAPNREEIKDLAACVLSQARRESEAGASKHPVLEAADDASRLAGATQADAADAAAPSGADDTAAKAASKRRGRGKAS